MSKAKPIIYHQSNQKQMSYKRFKALEFYHKKKNLIQETERKEMLSKFEKYNEIKEKVGKYVDLQLNKSNPPTVIQNFIIPITNYILTLLLFTV